MLANQWSRLANTILYQFYTQMPLIRDPLSRIPKGWNPIEELLWSGMRCELCSF